MNNNLLEQIRALRLGHMSHALELQWSQPMTYTSLSFEERLGLLLEHELLQREVSKVNRLRRQSKLRLDAQPSQRLPAGTGPEPAATGTVADRRLCSPS